MPGSIGFSPRGDLLDGVWVVPDASVRTGEITRGDPGDDTVALRRYPTAVTHVARAVDAARRAARAWAKVPESDRVRFLARLRGELDSRAEALARAISGDMGKPLWESRQEVDAMRQKIDVVVDDGLADLALRRPVGVAGGYFYRPLGVVAVIGPFNFPARLPHGQAVTALVAGNAVIMKASELAPAVGELYADAVVAAGAPRGVFQLVQGGPDVGAALSMHPDVDAVCFTGSYATGVRIARACVEQPSKVLVLEMGGKNAAIVLADADLEQAAHEIAAAATITTGQRCTATTRLVVERRIAGRLVARIAELVGRLRIGHALVDGVNLGPLASHAARERFLGIVRAAEGSGEVETVVATDAAGSELTGARSGSYVRPSIHVVRRRDPASAYQRDELFGPDLAVYEVGDGDLDEALAVANDTDYGLCLSVYTRSDGAWQRVQEEARAGIINRNRPTIGSSTRMPFAGVGRSGNQRDGGVHLIRSTVRPVAAMEKPAGLDAGALPPGFPMDRMGRT